MAWKVLLPAEIAEAGKRHLRENGCEVKMGSGDDERTVIREVADCDALLVRIGAVTRAILDAGPRLKVIARHGVGVDNIDVAYATEKGIWVTNGPASNSNSVAEHVIMLMLMCARNTYAVDREFRNGHGDYQVRHRYNGFELEGKTLGLIGLGRIGTLVAGKAVGLGMKVIGFDAFIPPDKVDPRIELASGRDEVLRNADIVSIHIPALPETRNAFGAAEFAMMKPSAVFINCARGEVVDETALRRALEEKDIRAAGLDCYQPEPPSPDNPILTMKNVAATPHNAAHTRESLDRMALHAAIGVIEVLNGMKPTWPVNNPKGV